MRTGRSRDKKQPAQMQYEQKNGHHPEQTRRRPLYFILLAVRRLVRSRGSRESVNELGKRHVVAADQQDAEREHQ